MPKKIAKKDLPSPDDVPTTKPLVERLEKRRTTLAAARDGPPHPDPRSARPAGT